jgi:hypothetical protein
VRRRALTFFLAISVSSGFTSAVDAQSIGSQLSALLTEQRAVSDFVPDVEAANQTFATVAGLFGVELATLPVSASSGGFVYRLNRDLGLVERASDGFGPFFTERVLRNSRGQVSVGITYQFARFSSLQGRARCRIGAAVQRRHPRSRDGVPDDHALRHLWRDRPAGSRPRGPNFHGQIHRFAQPHL